MIRGAALIHDVTLYGVGAPVAASTSVFGDPEYEEEAGVTVPAFVSPIDATEEEINRDVRLNRYAVVLELEATIDGISELEWQGRRYRVIGEPREYASYRGGHHYEIEIRREEG